MRRQDARISRAMRSAVAMLAMSAVALLVVLPNHPAGRPPSEDAGVFFYGAQRILHGGLPYRDIWDHKPPGVYAIDAIGLALGDIAGVWAVQLVSLVVAAVATLRATRIFGGGAATFGTFTWLVGAPRLFLTDGVQTSYVEFYGLPLQLVALALLPRDAAALRPGGRAIAIGALGGAAFLLKPTLGGVWIAAAILALLLRRRRRKDAGPARHDARSRRGRARDGGDPRASAASARARGDDERSSARRGALHRRDDRPTRDGAGLGIAHRGALPREPAVANALRVPVRGPRNEGLRVRRARRRARRRPRTLSARVDRRRIGRQLRHAASRSSGDGRLRLARAAVRGPPGDGTGRRFRRSQLRPDRDDRRARLAGLADPFALVAAQRDPPLRGEETRRDRDEGAIDSVHEAHCRLGQRQVGHLS